VERENIKAATMGRLISGLFLIVLIVVGWWLLHETPAENTCPASGGAMNVRLFLICSVGTPLADIIFPKSNTGFHTAVAIGALVGVYGIVASLGIGAIVLLQKWKKKPLGRGEPSGLLNEIGNNTYFLGFIFTLMGLLYSFTDIPTTPGATINIGNIVNKCGVALVTTVVGLCFRIVISIIFRPPRAVEPSRKLMDDLDSATDSFLHDSTNLNASVGDGDGDGDPRRNTSCHDLAEALRTTHGIISMAFAFLADRQKDQQCDERLLESFNSFAHATSQRLDDIIHRLNRELTTVQAAALSDGEPISDQDIPNSEVSQLVRMLDTLVNLTEEGVPSLCKAIEDLRTDWIGVAEALAHVVANTEVPPSHPADPTDMEPDPTQEPKPAPAPQVDISEFKPVPKKFKVPPDELLAHLRAALVRPMR